ncbi:gluconeogenesis factor YvcK family protein [Haloplasma contractile]|uniref:Putative gluconeogenesis factor n=1 Tax=Haloplasma contractile SSD-17B TaxID=1033810 RepID=U2FJF1_9MOLU|nr:uridine diphosphate-N-acetylglucosamine-binding protein YvcK [Haloplasma contractile]ERJ10957.1 gluconeosis factor protein [Haloplasma contractile SSD-17B]ERJ12965.1 gluconeosis factor protein [Haloplasma contractile SSD-17B]
MYDRDPNVVVIGGGTGLSTLLTGLKRFPVNLTAIVTVADDGGSSGRIRKNLNTIPPGDIRKVLISLSETDDLLGKLFDYRFNKDSYLSNDSLGNLLLYAMTDITGDSIKAIEYLSQVLNVKGTVLPVSTKPIELCADMEDGTTVYGESNITSAGKKIDQIYFKNQDVKATPHVIKAIENADMIVLGPGSLYTSIIPNILIPEVKEALIKSEAIKIYISNVMTELGETDDFDVSDHLTVLESYLGKNQVETVLANEDYEVDGDILIRYLKSGCRFVTVDYKTLSLMGIEVYTAKLLSVNDEEYIRHDSRRLATHVFALLLDKMKND